MIARCRIGGKSLVEDKRRGLMGIRESQEEDCAVVIGL